ncbi:MAG: DedA family protein [Thermodesulfobacteriota bacterium]
MTLQHLVENYGYLAIWIGTFLEGETILVLGGLAAQQGFLSLPWVVVCAFTGSLFGDQFFFFLGRRHGSFLLAHRPSWRAKFERAERLFARIQTPLIIIFRFLYGLRAVLPFFFGLSSVPLGRFMFLNVIGALVWAVAVGVAGFLFGHALTALLGDLKKYEMKVLIAVGITMAFFWALHFLVRWLRKKRDW